MKSKEYLNQILYEINPTEPRREECLIWPFSRQTCGYARFSGQLVSRIICEKVHGKAPEDKPFALHNCDKGHLGCVEPTHLEWGDPKKNSKDRIRAGTNKTITGPLSEEHKKKLKMAARKRIDWFKSSKSEEHKKKLSQIMIKKYNVDVDLIKRLRSEGLSVYKIAELTKYSRNTVMKYWK